MTYNQENDPELQRALLASMGGSNNYEDDLQRALEASRLDAPANASNHDINDSLLISQKEAALDRMINEPEYKMFVPMLDTNLQNEVHSWHYLSIPEKIMIIDNIVALQKMHADQSRAMVQSQEREYAEMESKAQASPSIGSFQNVENLLDRQEEEFERELDRILKMTEDDEKMQADMRAKREERRQRLLNRVGQTDDRAKLVTQKEKLLEQKNKYLQEEERRLEEREKRLADEQMRLEKMRNIVKPTQGQSKPVSPPSPKLNSPPVRNFQPSTRRDFSAKSPLERIMEEKKQEKEREEIQQPPARSPKLVSPKPTAEKVREFLQNKKTAPTPVKATRKAPRKELPAPEEWKEGMKVEIKGFTSESKSALNGERGTVSGILTHGLKIQLDNGKVLMVKPKNLVLISEF